MVVGGCVSQDGRLVAAKQLKTSPESLDLGVDKNPKDLAMH